MSKGTPYALSAQVAVADGATLGSARLYFYQTGTTTNQLPYEDSDLSTQYSSNPILADANGEFDPIYLDPDESVDYRVRLEDSSGTLVWQEDGVSRYRENFASGSFSVDWAGFSADPSNTTCNWYRFGRIAQLEIPLGTGTSNAATFSLTEVPASIRPVQTQWYFMPFAQDNGSHIQAVAAVFTDGSVKFAPADAAYDLSGWTTSSTKGILTTGTIFYRIANS
jgi:hypothetical protein